MKQLTIVVVALLCLPSLLLAASTLDYYRSGFAHYKRRNFARAAKIWRALLKHRRSDLSRGQQLRTCLGLAQAYHRLGKKRHAIKVLKFANRIAPGHKAIKRAHAKITGSSADSSSSSGGSSKSMSISEALEAVDTGLMMEKASAGQGAPHFKEALPVFQKALKEGRSPSRANFGVGTCLLYTSSDLKEAEKYLAKSLDIRPTDGRANLQMAILQGRLGDLEKEIHYLDTAVTNGNTSPSVLASLAGAYGRRMGPGDKELVLRHARTAIGYDASYGASIAEQVTDEPLKIEIGKMVAKAEMEAYGLGKKEQQMAQKMASKLAKNPGAIDKLKAKYGNKIPDNIEDKIPAKYRKLFERNKDKIQRYLGR